VVTSRSSTGSPFLHRTLVFFHSDIVVTDRHATPTTSRTNANLPGLRQLTRPIIPMGLCPVVRHNAHAAVADKSHDGRPIYGA
jgi:hypothetical protein